MISDEGLKNELRHDKGISLSYYRVINYLDLILKSPL
jgi:hypothetical protein